MKRILLIAIACVLGPFFLWRGAEGFQNAKRLVSEGKDVTAQVEDHLIQTRSRGGRHYYLRVAFEAEPGQRVVTKVEVTHDEYQKASVGGTTALRYLPSKPSICSVGEPVPAWRSSFISGGILLLSGLVLVVLGNRGGLSTRDAAEKIAKHVDALCESHYEYASVNATDFSHLDLTWYDTSQRWLQEKWFALLGDEENLTFKRTSKGNRTLLRTMLGRDGTCLAYLYHFKPATTPRTLGGNGFKILELQSHFSNGAFLSTSNAEAAGKLDSPPGVDALRLPGDASLEAILATHDQRYNSFLANNPGVSPGRITNLEDVHGVQNVLQEIKAAFRRNVGITREELQRMAGPRLCPAQIEVLHAEVEKVQAERKREAA